MYLEKIEVQGFKSFANKNVLKFPGLVTKDKYGLTAIVGPNGSGKSNSADAIRWVLGEQSMKTLRGKKGEDVIFSGSDKKGKLGMAEVSLFLNNADKKAPIEYSELVLTRRLYRDGESAYLINNSRVRLADIQMMLAKASFGQRTYSVIGQGMVEGFLNTTLAERKEFFDEATGVKQFQIKRDDSLNKLKASYENLSQVSMLLTEIEPRLKSLTRQVKRLEKREELEDELKDLQLKYYRKLWHEINDKFNEFNNKFLELEKEKIEKDKKLAHFNNELEKMEKSSGVINELEKWQEKLNETQSKKDILVRRIAQIDAQIEIKLESVGKFDLSWLNNKKEELARENKKTKAELEDIEKVKEQIEEKNKRLISDASELVKDLQGLNNELMSLSQDSNKEELKIDKELKNYLEKLEQAYRETDIEKIKELIVGVTNSLKKALKNIKNEADETTVEKMQEIQKKIIELSTKKEELSEVINENNLKINSKNERFRMFKEKIERGREELEKIEGKLRQGQSKFDFGAVQDQKKDLEKELAGLEEKRDEIKKEIIKINDGEEAERSKLFSLQKNVSTLQNEINEISRQLSEARVNAARYETRLEDLEYEIRDNLGNLADVKNERQEHYMGFDEAPSKIKNIKHQLELIGGIDVEAQKEYEETKERFDFLSEQVDDLTKTIKSLESIIKELDGTIREKFDKEFKVIAEKFEEYFKILFSGGRAKIVKVMEEEKKKTEKEEDEGDNEKQENDLGIDEKRIKFLKKHNATGLAGIEVQATPPGKKIKTLAMLSGGERALTAIALICAIISANPSPFVVLDEVDAALDEANSERLAKILDDLSRKTQFIVITHNRASMRRASILYGVTMGDDGVSKLLSVKLEDIKID